MGQGYAGLKDWSNCSINIRTRVGDFLLFIIVKKRVRLVVVFPCLLINGSFFDRELYLSCWCFHPSCRRRLCHCLARLLCCPRGRCLCLWFPRKRWGCWADCCCSAVARGDGPQCVWRASWPAQQPRLQGTQSPSHPE